MSASHQSRGVKAHILLAGGLRAPQLASAAERSILDLFITSNTTVLDHWIEKLASLDAQSDEPAPVRVLYGDAGPTPGADREAIPKHVSFEKEASGYRGPAGALKDACSEYSPDDTLLVADAGRFLDANLTRVLETHDARSADITVLCDAVDQPLGLYLMKCKVLELVPKAGFMDLKEQLLNKAIESGMGVWAHRAKTGQSLSVRTRINFLEAARAAAGLPPIVPGAAPVLNGVTKRDHRTPMQVISRSAAVAGDAVILDSVVMPGATVGSGAVIARSIVSPGARVEAGAQVVDAVVGPRGVRLDEFETAGRRRMGR